MKMLINSFIVLVAVQLSASVPLPSASTGPTQSSSYLKRYQLFDFMVTKINDINADRLIHMTSKYSTLLKDYNEWLFDNNKNLADEETNKKYEDLKSQLETFITETNQFKSDRQNCTLQRKMQTDYFKITSTYTNIKNSSLQTLWDKHKSNDFDEEQVKKDIENNFIKMLTIETERFLQSLNDDEKKENQEFVEWCEKFLSASNIEEKMLVFDDVYDFLEEEFERESKAEDVNCKLLAIMEFNGNAIAHFIAAIIGALFNN